MPFLSTVKSSYGFGRGVAPVSGAIVTTLAEGFVTPRGVAVIPSSGVIVVADHDTNLIQLVTPLGVVTTLAGSGQADHVDGAGTNASFCFPTGVAYDPTTGNIVVADSGNHRIRLVTYPGGVVSTLAGSGNMSFADGTGAGASFYFPTGVAYDPTTGNIVVADSYNRRIRIVTPLGVVTTLAGGSGWWFEDGTGSAASFGAPEGVTVIPSTGVIVVADRATFRIRLVTPLGVVTTLAGNDNNVSTDGTGATASFGGPEGVAYDPTTGNIVVADTFSHRIRLVTYPGGVVTTLAGNCNNGVNEYGHCLGGFADGTATTASFSSPKGVAVVPSTGVVVVADHDNNRIRLIT